MGKFNQLLPFFPTDGDRSKILDESDLASWLQKEPLFKTLLVNIFKTCFSPPQEKGSQVSFSGTGPNMQNMGQGREGWNDLCDIL